MEGAGYTVGQLARMSGVSVRTLHHYDQLGLLVPERKPNGYRSYGSREAARLQLILLYRSCGMDLADIAEMVDSPSFSEEEALERQLALLRQEQARIDTLINTVERTLDATRKGETMSDRARFEGLKAQAVADNERDFGVEARKRHGDAAIDDANQKLLSMDEETWNDMQALERRILELLTAALATGDPTSPQSAELVRAHARWIQLHWGEGTYSTDAHRGLADGYLADERFVAYYDTPCGEGATRFLRDAIHANL